MTARKPAAKKPPAARTRKAAVEKQSCTGCGQDKELTEFGRTSKARGGKPMRRCRACITAESKARRETREKQDESTATPKGKPSPRGKGSKPTSKAA